MSEVKKGWSSPGVFERETECNLLGLRSSGYINMVDLWQSASIQLMLHRNITRHTILKRFELSLVNLFHHPLMNQHLDARCNLKNGGSHSGTGDMIFAIKSCTKMC